MKWEMGSWRVWLFRGLVAVAAGLMVRSFIMPWWTADITHRVEDFEAAIKIYSYGIPSSYASAEYWASDVTPFHEIVLAWVYLAVSVGLILLSTWLKGRKGRWLLGGVGLIYIAYAAIAAFVVIANGTGSYDISLQGWSIIHREGGPVDIFASLQFEYYLAYAAGGLCIALALFRNIITGRPKHGM